MGDTAPVSDGSEPSQSDAIGLLLDYCMRYYDRQFITRHKVNSDILIAFHQQLREYFVNGHPERNGLPTVAYFAEKACLSPNYFGDLISKESGTTAQPHVDYPQVHCRDEPHRGYEHRPRPSGTNAQQRGVPAIHERINHHVNPVSPMGKAFP